MIYRLKYKMPNKLEWQYEEVRASSPMLAKRVLVIYEPEAFSIIKMR